MSWLHFGKGRRAGPRTGAQQDTRKLGKSPGSQRSKFADELRAIPDKELFRPLSADDQLEVLRDELAVHADLRTAFSFLFNDSFAVPDTPHRILLVQLRDENEGVRCRSVELLGEYSRCQKD